MTYEEAIAYITPHPKSDSSVLSSKDLREAVKAIKEKVEELKEEIENSEENYRLRNMEW